MVHVQLPSGVCIFRGAIILMRVFNLTVSLYVYIKMFDLNINITGLLEKAMAPHSGTVAWKIPRTEEPGRLQSMGVTGSRTRLSDFTFSFRFHALEKEMAPHSSVLAWRTPGMGEPGGLQSMGSHRVGHD